MTQPQGTTTYQLTTLTPGLAEKLIQDGSPTAAGNTFWQLLTTELMTANLTPVDFANILDMVEKAFANMLTGMSEDYWAEFVIEEKIWDKDGNGNLVPVVVNKYTIVEFWDQIFSKVYVKCCNSRDGHLLKSLTEQRVSTLHEERGGIMYAGAGGAPLPMPAQEDKGGWKL